MNKKIIVPLSIATAISAGEALPKDISEGVLDQFLKNQLLETWQIFQSINTDSNNIKQGYNIEVISKNNNPLNRPNAKFVEGASDVANLTNFANQGLPLEENITNSKELIKNYLMKENVVDSSVAKADSLIIPAFSPDSLNIVKWSFTGDISKYLNTLDRGEEPIIDPATGKILIFNDAYGTKTIKDTVTYRKPHPFSLGLLTKKATKIVEREVNALRQNPIKHTFNLPYEDVVDLYRRLKKAPEGIHKQALELKTTDKMTGIREPSEKEVKKTLEQISKAEEAEKRSFFGFSGLEAGLLITPGTDKADYFNVIGGDNSNPSLPIIGLRFDIGKTVLTIGAGYRKIVERKTEESFSEPDPATGIYGDSIYDFSNWGHRWGVLGNLSFPIIKGFNLNVGILGTSRDDNPYGKVTENIILPTGDKVLGQPYDLRLCESSNTDIYPTIGFEQRFGRFNAKANLVLKQHEKPQYYISMGYNICGRKR